MTTSCQPTNPIRSAHLGARLLIDIGNSRCKVAFFNELEMEQWLGSNGSAPLAFLREVIGERHFDIVVLSSVQRYDPNLVAYLEGRARKLVVVDGDTPTMLRINYQTSDRLGADRLAAGVGAITCFPREDLLVIDFGTAITFDYISKEREFVGGNISLGMNMRFKALHHFTQGLPLIELEKEEEIPCWGIDTRGNITAGVVRGIVQEIEGYITKNQDKKIIFTGGDAIFFAKLLKTPIFVDCNLIFTGLSVIAQSYAE